MQPSNVSENVPNLELGEFFTIQRGRITQPAMEIPLPPDGAKIQSMPAQYDRGWDGAVFKVLYQEHTFVAAEVIFPAMNAGQTVHIDVGELEVMPLSPQYIKALESGVQFKTPLVNPLSIFAKIDAINRAAGNDVRGKDFPKLI